MENYSLKKSSKQLPHHFVIYCSCAAVDETLPEFIRFHTLKKKKNAENVDFNYFNYIWNILLHKFNVKGLIDAKFSIMLSHCE